MQQPAAVEEQHPGQSEQYCRMVQSLWSEQGGWRFWRAQVRVGPPVSEQYMPSPHSRWEAHATEHVPQTQTETSLVLVDTGDAPPALRYRDAPLYR